MNRRQKKRLATLVIGLLTLAVAYGQQRIMPPGIKNVAERSQPGLYKVTDFIDGDTVAVDMNGTTEKIRFIGVDTPETHDPRKSVECFGQAAANFTKSFIGQNNVRLESDPQNTNRDRYNRLLRYVYTPDNRLVNAEIIKQGYGFAYTYFPFSKIEEFRSYETEARTKNLGLWSSCKPATDKNGQTHSNPV